MESAFVRWDDRARSYVQTTMSALFEPSNEYFFTHEWEGLDIDVLLEKVDAETLVIFGEADPVVVPSLSALKQKMRAAHYVKIPDAGHFAWMDNPEAYSAAVLNFLEGSSADPT